MMYIFRLDFIKILAAKESLTCISKIRLVLLFYFSSPHVKSMSLLPPPIPINPDPGAAVGSEMFSVILRVSVVTSLLLGAHSRPRVANTWTGPGTIVVV